MTALKVIVAAVTTALFFMVATALAVVSLLATHLVTVSVVALLVALIVGYGRRRGTTPPPAPRPVIAVGPPAAMAYGTPYAASAHRARALPPRPVR